MPWSSMRAASSRWGASSAQNRRCASTKWLSLCHSVSSPSKATTSMVVALSLLIPTTVLAASMRGERQGNRWCTGCRRVGYGPGPMASAAPGLTAGADSAAELCERVLTVLGGRAEAVVSAGVGASALTRFANGHIHQNTSEDKRGVRLTLALDGRVARATTTRTDDDGLAALVDRALAAAALRPADPDFAGFAPPATVAAVEHWDGGTAAATPDHRAEIVAAFVGAGVAGAAGGTGGSRSVGPAGGPGQGEGQADEIA